MTPVLTFDVGQTEWHVVDVYLTSRRRDLEVYVDGERVTPVPLASTTKGTERYELRVGQSEPHTVRIERRGGRRAAFEAYIDGWPVPDNRAAQRAARLEVAAKNARSRPGGGETPGRRTGRYVLAGVILLLLVWGASIFVRNQVNDASLARHGKAITARIVDTEHDQSDSGTSDYLYVWIPACSCPVRVATDNPASHPKGSTIAVLYDTTDPTNVRPLVDGNSTGWDWAGDVFFFGLAVFGTYCAYELMSPELDRLRARRTAAKQASPAAT
ncbi:MAG TPA: DUF3592 domain-containing protein [Acidimicrobiales bacterium]|jgi:hypothetical protein|nr:DUF3592 domain-containing protein [Acidimicrobiales bacterium]